MGRDLIVDWGVHGAIVGDLRNARTEFESADGISDLVAESVGHAGLGDAIRDFSTSWDHRRAEFTEQIVTLQENLARIDQAFTEADTEIAKGLANQ